MGRTWAASGEKWCKTMRDDAKVKAQVRLPFDPSVLVAEMGQNGLGNRCSKAELRLARLVDGAVELIDTRSSPCLGLGPHVGHNRYKHDAK